MAVSFDVSHPAGIWDDGPVQTVGHILVDQVLAVILKVVHGADVLDLDGVLVEACVVLVPENERVDRPLFGLVIGLKPKVDQLDVPVEDGIDVGSE